MRKAIIPQEIKDALTHLAYNVWYDGRGGLPATDRDGNPRLKFLVTKWLDADLNKRLLDDMTAQFLQVKEDGKKLNKHEIYRKYDFKQFSFNKDSINAVKALTAQVPGVQGILMNTFVVAKPSAGKDCAVFAEKPFISYYCNTPSFGYGKLLWDEEKQSFKVVALYGFRGEKADITRKNWARKASRTSYIKQILNDFTERYLDNNCKFIGIDGNFIKFEIA